MNNLKNLRKSKNLSQSEVAKIINKTTSAYGYYEVERNEPDLQSLIKLADYYDVSIDFLVGRPRPFDFPIVATDIQKKLINYILTLDDSLCEKIEAYAYGINDGKKDQQKIQGIFGGK